MTRFFQCGQRLDDGCHLHAIVGGAKLAPKKLLLRLTGAEHSAPAAGARITLAGAVGVDHDCLLGRYGC